MTAKAASSRPPPPGHTRPPPPQLCPTDAEEGTRAAASAPLQTLPNTAEVRREGTLEVGQRVCAWFYGEWHAAVVRRVQDRAVEVRWESEASVSVLPLHYVKPMPSASPPVAQIIPNNPEPSSASKQRGDTEPCPTSLSGASGEQKASSELLEKFLQSLKVQGVDEEAAEDLKSCPLEIQEMVLAKGDVTCARNPSAMLRVRMNQAWRELKKNQRQQCNEQLRREKGKAEKFEKLEKEHHCDTVGSKAAAHSEDGSTAETRDASASDYSLDFVSSAASTSPGASLARDEAGEVDVGDEVSACFYGEWHLAIVRKIEGETVEVVWKSEPSVSRLPISQIKPVSKSAPTVCNHASQASDDSSRSGNALVEERGAAEPRIRATVPTPSSEHTPSAPADDNSIGERGAIGRCPAEEMSYEMPQGEPVASPQAASRLRSSASAFVPLLGKFARALPLDQEQCTNMKVRLTRANAEQADPPQPSHQKLRSWADTAKYASAAAHSAVSAERKAERVQAVGEASPNHARNEAKVAEDRHERKPAPVLTHSDRKHPAGAVASDFKKQHASRLWTGVIAEFEADAENGWIESPEAYAQFQSRVYLHRSVFCKSNAKVGDAAEFSIHVNKFGQPQASCPLNILPKTVWQADCGVKESVQHQTEQQGVSPGQSCTASVDMCHPQAVVEEQRQPPAHTAPAAVPDSWEDATEDVPDASLEEPAGLLGVALQRASDLHAKDDLPQLEYKDENRRFKIDLQAACGAAELAEFKQCSADFRRSTSADAAAVYAERVLQVFSAASRNTGEEKAGELLGDLVLLLPNRTLRQQLHDELARRHQSLQGLAAIQPVVGGSTPASASVASEPKTLLLNDASQCTALQDEASVQDAVPMSVEETADAMSRAALMEQLATGVFDCQEQQAPHVDTSSSSHPAAAEDSAHAKADDELSKEEHPETDDEAHNAEPNAVVADEEAHEEGNSAELEGSALVATAREKRKARQQKKKQAKASSKAIADEEFDKCLEEFSAP